jgi:hypothetical protein
VRKLPISKQLQERTMLRLVGALVLTLGLAAAAQAYTPHDTEQVRNNQVVTTVPPSAPEIDPASAMAALSLLAGTIAVLRSRR